MTAVRWSRTAQSDLDEIWLYIAQDSENAADVLVDPIIDTSRALPTYSRMGVARPELGDALRSLTVGNYILFYSADSRGVLIERVLHGRRDIGPQCSETAYAIRT